MRQAATDEMGDLPFPGPSREPCTGSHVQESARPLAPVKPTKRPSHQRCAHGKPQIGARHRRRCRLYLINRGSLNHPDKIDDNAFGGQGQLVSPVIFNLGRLHQMPGTNERRVGRNVSQTFESPLVKKSSIPAQPRLHSPLPLAPSPTDLQAAMPWAWPRGRQQCQVPTGWGR